MSTVDSVPLRAQSEPRRHPRPILPASGRCSCRIRINGTSYRLKPVPCHPSVGSRAYQLRKDAGAVYTIVRTVHGTVECDCADYVLRREGATPFPCKHGQALIALGMLEAPPLTRPSVTRPSPSPLIPRHVAEGIAQTSLVGHCPD